MLFNKKKEATVINVAVYGSRESGKSKLVECLNNRTFTRSADRRKFKLVSTEIYYATMSLFSDFDFVLFTFKSTSPAGRWGEWSAFRNIINQDYSDYYTQTCLVGTMVDLVPPDSAQDIALQCLPATVSFYSRLKYISVSSLTCVGIKTLESYVVNQIFPSPLPKSTSWSGILDTFGGKLLDTLAHLFALPVPPNINQDTEDEQDIDDDTVDILSQTPECLAHNAHLASFYPKNAFNNFNPSCPVFRFTPSLIAKILKPLEYMNTTYARSRLDIPIPQPRYPHLTYSLVTDFIQGKPLNQCWESLGIYMQFRIACTLRTYVLKMRRLTQATPGSPNGGHVHGFVFSNGLYSGPFASAATFQRYIHRVTYHGWLAEWNSYAEALKDGRPTGPRPEQPTFIDSDNALVFTHADISPSNLILSDEGILWLIDWATCGFYPEWIESLAMYRYAGERSPKRWNYLTWFAVGPLPKNSYSWDYYFLAESDHYSSMEPFDGIIP